MSKILLFMEDAFEDIEAVYPYHRLIEEGYEVNIVGPEKDKESVKFINQ
jgi:protease I